MYLVIFLRKSMVFHDKTSFLLQILQKASSNLVNFHLEGPSLIVNKKELTLRCAAVEFAKFLFCLSSNMSYKDGDIYFFGFNFLIAVTSLNTMTSTVLYLLFSGFEFFFLIESQ